VTSSFRRSCTLTSSTGWPAAWLALAASGRAQRRAGFKARHHCVAAAGRAAFARSVRPHSRFARGCAHSCVPRCMRPIRSVLVVGLLALPAAGSAQTAVTMTAYRSPGGGVLFSPPTPIAWDSLVPADLRPPALEADSVRRRRLFAQRGPNGSTEVTFLVPLPAELQARHYYLMDSTDVYETRPTGLRGVLRIDWRRSAAQIVARRTYGYVHATARVPGSQGFVLVTAQPATLEVDSSHYSSDALLAPRGGTYPYQGTPFWRIAGQYLVRQTAPSAQQWAWIHWAPDSANVEGGCTSRFALFKWDPDPVLVGSLADGCDV